MRYVCFVVDLGEEGVERDAYFEIATESRITGGYPGYLSEMVVAKADETLNRLNERLTVLSARFEETRLVASDPQ